MNDGTIAGLAFIALLVVIFKFDLILKNFHVLALIGLLLLLAKFAHAGERFPNVEDYAATAIVLGAIALLALFTNRLTPNRIILVLMICPLSIWLVSLRPLAKLRALFPAGSPETAAQAELVRAKTALVQAETAQRIIDAQIFQQKMFFGLLVIIGACAVLIAGAVAFYLFRKSRLLMGHRQLFPRGAPRMAATVRIRGAILPLPRKRKLLSGKSVMKLMLAAMLVLPGAHNASGSWWNPFENQADVIRAQRELEETQSRNRIEEARLAQDLRNQNAILQMRTQPYALLQAQIETVRAESRQHYRRMWGAVAVALGLLIIIIWILPRMWAYRSENAKLRRMVRGEQQKYANLYKTALVLQDRLRSGSIGTAPRMRQIKEG